MTPEETREAGQLMLDWADQQFEVESKPSHWERGWIKTDRPEWDWHEFIYRRKPTPKLRPYTPEECVGLLGRRLKRSGGQELHEVLEYLLSKRSGWFILQDPHGRRREYTASGLLHYYTHPDSSPCGVEE